MSKYKKISLEVKNDIAYLGFGFNSDKSMTVLDEITLTELKEAIEYIKNDEKKYNGLIFYSHVKGCFLAGADISLIAGMDSEADGQKGAEAGQDIYNMIEDIKIPTVACVDGVCLGGGCELILSCKTILASDDRKTMIGLPEVKLGLIPGFGGTFRLPKRVGLPNSLDLILSGKTLNGKKAKKYGLVDEVYPTENLIDAALKYFKKSEHKSSFKESIEGFATDNFVARKLIFQKARESVLKKTKGFYQAPLKILDVMESGQGKSRGSYLSLESLAFGELCVSEQSKNLQHIFFMHEGSKKYSATKGNGTIKEVKRGACLGAGTMGGGIAWMMADMHMSPIMKDLNYEALELGLKQSSLNFMGAVKRRKMTRDEFEKKQRSISAQLDFRGFNRTDLVIEAVVENMDIKKKVFAELETKVSKDCLITSNTSSLSVEAMAEAFEDSTRFAGLHFFNPVNRMPLVEIITHSRVTDETVEALYNWALKAKKTPIVVKDGPGFLVNRILMPYLNEAAYLLEEGISVKDIDNACLNFGMPMGPCRLMDEVGIDVASKVAKIMYDGLGERAKSNGLSKKLEEKEILGRKNSKGFYLYDEKGKHTEVNPELSEFLPTDSKKMDEVEIQLRVFLPMINEAAMILDDKIVDSPSDVDLGLIFGIGFPPFRGGLLRYADSEGLENILEKINSFKESVDSERYSPAPLLERLVNEKKKFYEVSGE